MKSIVTVIVVFFAVGLAAPAHAEDGKALFAQKCASCHGPDGKGQTPMGKKLVVPDLTKVKDSEAAIAGIIENGKPPKMLAYKGKLTPEQVQALAKYVKAGVK
jgi:cbb3-type cytochrome c oxidase subunit III